MATKKYALVAYPSEVIADIDDLIGAENRTSYLVELARRSASIHRQREALRAATPIWQLEDHPELAQGSGTWVRRIRALDSGRSKRT